MPTNIEIKARTDRMDRLRDAVRKTGAVGPYLLLQKDTFFGCPCGRMKLREISGDEAELIVYVRADAHAPKRSDYVRLPVADPDRTRQLLAVTHGVVGVVEKRREVFLLGNVRVHLDEVAGLGQFLELEVVLERQQSESDGAAVARELMAKLGVCDADLVPCAYVDMLAAQSGSKDHEGCQTRADQTGV